MSDVADDLYVFATTCGWVKIGRSVDVANRFRTLSTILPPSIRLSILEVAVGLGAYESAVHEALRSFRKQGEWFKRGCLQTISDAGGLGDFVASLSAQPSNSRGQPALRPDDKRLRANSTRWPRRDA
jgi:hypothetical protein